VAISLHFLILHFIKILVLATKNKISFSLSYILVFILSYLEKDFQKLENWREHESIMEN